MNIYFVRHGQTITNINGVFYDQDAGPGLTELGKKQAQNTAEKLKNIHFDVCYCSPRLRTKETAQIILQYHPNTPIIEDERLAERNWGDAVGIPTNTFNPNRWYRYREFPYANIETVDQMQDRLYEFYQSLNPNQTILVVSHHGCYRISNALFNKAPKDNDFDNFPRLDNAGWVIFNTTPHRF